jgi:Putative transposase/Transposase zinc-binding domain
MAPPSSVATTVGGERPRYEVADIVRTAGAAYRHTHLVTAAQAVVLRAIERCRTAALGGHVEACTACGAQQIAYNSCRNRHCPKCQGGARAKWLAAQQARLLPVEYFHVVFTLPHELHALIRVNPRRLYARLFHAAAATLHTFARDPTHLGAELGGTAVLHTWGQTLTQHVHVHCVVTGGGLSHDGRRWRSTRPGFLFPVRALSKVFRGKFLAGLERLRARGTLTFAGDSAALDDRATWTTWRAALRAQDWLLYAKPPFGGPERVLKYLSRYTHRVASANHRIVFVGDGVVRFCWKDSADHHRVKVMTLAADEFLRRFLLHVVPSSFRRIRHFGLLANRHHATKLAQCRALLGPVPTPATAPHSARGSAVGDSQPPSPALDRCPSCGGGPLRIIATLAPFRSIPP